MRVQILQCGALHFCKKKDKLHLTLTFITDKNIVGFKKGLVSVLANLLQTACPPPRGGGGVKSRMCPPYPQRVVKGD